MFTALGDPTRRMLFERLGRGACTVGDLARGLPVTRPAVSQHLKVLRTAGLVHCTARGTRRIYRIDPRGVEAMRDYLDQFWDRALSALKTLAEQEAR
jgi:DNA-binding transcriptional ArsR family regulator